MKLFIRRGRVCSVRHGRRRRLFITAREAIRHTLRVRVHEGQPVTFPQGPLGRQGSCEGLKLNCHSGKATIV